MTKVTSNGLRMARAILLSLALCPFAPAPNAFAQNSGAAVRVTGVVVDKLGDPITDARITLSGDGADLKQAADREGRFSFDSVTAREATLHVTAPGFVAVKRSWRAGDDADELRITMEVAITGSVVTVTADRTETRVSDTASSVAVLSGEDLTATSALTLDDALRQVPGFSLFRRSGSRTANPTSQGVSLRGVGASGASRAAVLDDGIPINDPFGGWVYWGRVPRQSVGRVEVVRGGSSSLYGTDALGGVINFIPREPAGSALSLEASYGNQQTPSASLFAGGGLGRWRASLAAEVFHTDGYVLVDEAERGRVDVPAGAEHSTLELTLERLLSTRGRVFARGSLFEESRENGTPLQTNSTHVRQLAAGFDWQSPRAGALSVRLFGGDQIFNQDFSAVSADRNSESLTRSQRVPAQQFGFTAQVARAVGSRQTIVAGVDAREVRGASDELGFFGGRLTSASGAGGRERTVGVFGQDIIRVADDWIVTVGGRFDRWRNYDALSTTRPLAAPGPTQVTTFEDRSETAFSPRLSVLHRLADNVSLVASGYRAFRAPTLNELYRSFRVGNVVTQANEDLRAERLTGGEAGATFAAFDRRLNVRGVFFWSEITRPVANVTLSVSPDLIVRRRVNLGRTRSRGIEVEADARITSSIVVSGGYLFADATVLEFPANRELEGLWLPQVPHHQLTFQARYINPSKMVIGLQGRFAGLQFDDDQNRFELERFFTLDALASRPVARGVEVFAAFENIFNERYSIGRTPVRTVGPPFLARIGIRVDIGAK
ncbi:MAG TPA: TonB-dependent receptor [Blastocatellia bacterium]|nr:TonB-dependent receptor [Blastocatellia bacterium]